MILVAPLAGTLRDLAEVPDPVFAERLMGDGVAIEPDEAPLLTAHAPCDGVIAKLFPGGHAMVIDGELGPILLHFGIDTVELHGEGLRALVVEGDRVAAGTPLVEIQVAALRGRGINLISPVIGIAGQRVSLLAPLGGRITPGEPLLELLPPSA
ncbi:MAG: PTS glucose transporter subunit IIA [Chloroflexi bacterium]|nr:MAG: PTS glucose transporter subunit IIA [Chloroflexota bacterium]